MFAPRKVLIYCCKFKNIFPSTREYAQQLKYNLEIEKKYLSWLIHNKFQQKWDKILDALYSLRAGSKCEPARRLYLTLLMLILSLWKPIFARRCTFCLFVFFSSSYSYLSHPQFSLLSFVAVNLLWISFSFFVC